MSRRKPRCAVCEGGWRNFWRLVFDGQHAPVCKACVEDAAPPVAQP